jgi:hypothetical protein
MNHKYRKKFVIIEAEQFRGFYDTPYPNGVEMEDNSNDPTKERYLFFVTTRGQKVYIERGDWIITEPDGIRYQCKPDIFAAIYEET